MDTNLHTLLEAAQKLPIEQQRELILKLTLSARPKKERGILRKHFGMINSGDPDSANNERIDAELAASYLDDHAPEN